jgi:hypothetical protein
MHIREFAAGTGVAALVVAGVAATTAASAPALATVKPAALTGGLDTARPDRPTVVLEPCVIGKKIETCWMDLQRRFQLGYGPAAWLPNMRWSSWRRNSATGTGTLWESDSTTWREGRVTVRLYRPRFTSRIDGGWDYFTRMHMSAVGKGVYHIPARTLKWTWSYGGQWLPGGAG